MTNQQQVQIQTIIFLNIHTAFNIIKVNTNIGNIYILYIIHTHTYVHIYISYTYTQTYTYVHIYHLQRNLSLTLQLLNRQGL